MNEMANIIYRNLSNQFIAGKHALQWVWQWIHWNVFKAAKGQKIIKANI